MLRCVTVAAALAALSLPVPGQTLQRNFPASALRGELQFVQAPEVRLNGHPARLAPGARIRGEHNLLVQPSALAGQAVTVHYTVDGYGLLMDVWLLSPAERAKQPWPVTEAEAKSWTFDPLAQSWSRQ
jgi:hypothetical protein